MPHRTSHAANKHTSSPTCCLRQLCIRPNNGPPLLHHVAQQRRLHEAQQRPHCGEGEREEGRARGARRPPVCPACYAAHRRQGSRLHTRHRQTSPYNQAASKAGAHMCGCGPVEPSRPGCAAPFGRPAPAPALEPPCWPGSTARQPHLQSSQGGQEVGSIRLYAPAGQQVCSEQLVECC